MIITYPIHIPYTKGREQRVVPDAIFHNSEILSGSYPVGKNRFWHGGVHLHPSDRTSPIRAIADGELVAYRYDEIDSTDAYFDKSPYSRSFVLLKHTTELGVTTLGTATLTFYSLYMHLQAWGQVKGKSGVSGINFLRKVNAKRQPEPAAPIADGACHDGNNYARVHRGDIVGYCGSVPDNLTVPSRGIHFEIFFDDVTFLDNAIKAVWGNSTLTSALKVVRELTSLVTTAVDPKKPLNTLDTESDNGFKKITVGKQAYWVSDDQITTSEIELPDPKNKKQTVKQKQHFANKKELRCYDKDPSKNQEILDKGTSIIPWQDPWMKPDEFREEKVEGKIFVQLYVVKKNELFWAEKSAIRYESDADWPDFYKVEEKGEYSQDGFIDDDGIRKLSDAFENNRSAGNNMSRDSSTVKLRHVVARHPTEWSKQDIAKRFGRVMEDNFGTAKLTPEQFLKLTAHIERLSFWDQIPGLPSPNTLWHVHPIKFIEHLAKCMWLSSDELKQIYPENCGTDEAISHGTSEQVCEKYRIDLNRCCYRYGINSRMRQAHFFGQGAIESMSLNKMLELDFGLKYENNKQLGNCQPGDGPRFKGRGFKQLTGRYNYAEYWCFKGWLTKRKDFDVGWEHDIAKRYPKVENPQKLIETSFNCIDAGCWYITLLRHGTVEAMDTDDVLKVTKAINGNDTALNARESFTNRIKKVLI